MKKFVATIGIITLLPTVLVQQIIKAKNSIAAPVRHVEFTSSTVDAVRVSGSGVVVERHDEQKHTDEQRKKHDVRHLVCVENLLSQLALVVRQTRGLALVTCRLIHLYNNHSCSAYMAKIKYVEKCVHDQSSAMFLVFTRLDF